jgi:hypothetical protein
MQIMPSQGRGMIEYLTWEDSEDEEYGKMVNNGEIKKYEISHFQYTGDTTLKFPSLYFNEQMVPVGDA